MAKWIDFEDLPRTGKTRVMAVFNKETKTNLGTIKWYGAFRQFSFFPEPNMVFEKTCMRDIADKMEQLMKEWKENKTKYGTI